jgi:hypothetical protein
MTMEHRGRARKGSSTKRLCIPARDFPSPSHSPRPAFNSKTSPILAPFSDKFPAFLPGSAQNIESDVTYSKQRTGEFLPGATTHTSVLRNLHNAPHIPPRCGHLNFAVRRSNFEHTSHTVCGYNVVDLRIAPATAGRPSLVRRRLELRHNVKLRHGGETEFGSYLARTISNLN